MAKLDDESLGDLSLNILYNIARFIVRKSKLKITCPAFISLPQNDKMTSISTDKSAIVHFVTYISHGGLAFASVGFFLITECAETFVRLLVLSGKNKITKQDQLISSTVNTVIMQKLNV